MAGQQYSHFNKTLLQFADEHPRSRCVWITMSVQRTIRDSIVVLDHLRDVSIVTGKRGEGTRCLYLPNDASIQFRAFSEHHHLRGYQFDYIGLSKGVSSTDPLCSRLIQSLLIESTIGICVRSWTPLSTQGNEVLYDYCSHPLITSFSQLAKW